MNEKLPNYDEWKTTPDAYEEHEKIVEYVRDLSPSDFGKEVAFYHPDLFRDMQDMLIERKTPGK